MFGNGHLNMQPLTATFLALDVGAVTAVQAQTLRSLTVSATIRPLRATTVGFRVALY